MSHAYSVLEKGRLATEALEPLSYYPLVRKLLFNGAGATSYYSYEDRPSNKFASKVRTTKTINTPNGLVNQPLSDKEITLNLIESLTNSGATNPENAPNYNQILKDKDREVSKSWRGRVKPLTKEQLNSGKYVPQNYSTKPYDLSNFPAAPDSIEKTNSKKNANEN